MAVARWDCPLLYIALCWYCPGFTVEGLRLRSAWIDDETMSDEMIYFFFATKIHFFATIDFQPSFSQ